MSLLEVSVQAGNLGPVIVLAGDADGSPTMQLDEALTAQVSARTTHLTIDATDLRSIDPATAQTLMLAALIVMVQGGSTVLVNPQEPVLKMLSHTRTTEMFTIATRGQPRCSPSRPRGQPGSHRTPAPPMSERRRPWPMTDHKHKLDEIITLRPAPAEPGNSSSGSDAYEIICRICGDDPGLDHQEVSPELQQIRGPHVLSAAVAAFVKHDESHNGTDNRYPVAPDQSGPGTKSSR